MQFEGLGKVVQITAAALGIPAAAAATYGVYQTYFTSEVSCQKLRASIISTMEKNVAPDAKRALLRKDVTDFVKTCGAADPDARSLFEAALREDKPATLPAPTPSPPQANPPAMSPDGIPTAIVAAFGRSPTGDVRGWVALTRGEPSRLGEPNFDGFALSLTSLPPAGTVLKARDAMPVWIEPQRGTNDEKKLQGTVPAGRCVRVVTTRPADGRTRTWGEVAPVPCPANIQVADMRVANLPTTGPLAGFPAASLPPVGFAAAAERKGWVALAARSGVANFEGFAIAEASLPPRGTVLTARWPLPIWNEAQGPAPNNLQAAQGRLGTGECVRVLATSIGPDRLWAEVAPASCS